MPVKFTAEELKQAVMETQEQRVVHRAIRSTDQKFPVFATPIENVLVYVPRTFVHATETGETMDKLSSVQHTWQIGTSQFGMARCYKDMPVELASRLGVEHPGTCPFDDARAECWKLINALTAQKCKESGLNPDNSEDKAVQSIRRDYQSKYLMIGKQTHYYTFPIVIIPKNPVSQAPAEDAATGMKAYYMMLNEKKYTDLFETPLEGFANNPGHPGGHVFLGKYAYPVETGKQRNARDAGREVTYVALQDLKPFEKLLPIAEKLVADFTPEKAAEVVIADNFLTLDESMSIINDAMTDVRRMIMALDKIGHAGDQPAAISGGAAAALQNFGTQGGTIPAVTAGNLGVAAPATSSAPETVPSTMPGSPIHLN